MAEKREPPAARVPGGLVTDHRTERLAAALRANLARRKAQARARAHGGSEAAKKPEDKA